MHRTAVLGDNRDALYVSRGGIAVIYRRESLLKKPFALCSVCASDPAAWHFSCRGMSCRAYDKCFVDKAVEGHIFNIKGKNFCYLLLLTYVKAGGRWHARKGNGVNTRFFHLFAVIPKTERDVGY